MASKSQQPHFLLFPLMAPGHMIPMIDIAKLLAQLGILITVVSTPLNSKRFTSPIARAVESGLQIHLVELQFPSEKFGLEKECENADMLPSLALTVDFFFASNLLQEQVERLVEELKPRPNCIISDMSLHYTSQIASKFRIPRISFNGSCCFFTFCLQSIHTSKILETVSSESEYFAVPGIPHRVQITKDQLLEVMHPRFKAFAEQIKVAEMVNYGMIFNSFEELEPEYVQEFKKANKVWCVGPVSLCNKDDSDKVQRGSKASIDESECLKWLDSQNPESVLYVCLGSLCNLSTSQLIELGLGLEASNRPFIWVTRGGEKSRELEKWIEENDFEERIKGRGLIIRGWAPQIFILSHKTIGGFLTHCGWNSTLEGICSGTPMLTCPLFGDQFFNGKLVVDVLKIGVEIGTEVSLKWGEEEKVEVLVKKEDVKRAIDRLMGEGEESEQRRKRVRELSSKAKRAMGAEGSSYLNLKLLVQDIMQLSYAV